MPAPSVSFTGDKNADPSKSGEQLQIVSAQAGLPWLTPVGSGGETRQPPMQEPRKADIASRQGGTNGSVFNAPYDPNAIDTGSSDA